MNSEAFLHSLAKVEQNMTTVRGCNETAKNNVNNNNINLQQKLQILAGEGRGLDHNSLGNSANRRLLRPLPDTDHKMQIRQNSATTMSSASVSVSTTTVHNITSSISSSNSSSSSKLRSDVPASAAIHIPNSVPAAAKNHIPKTSSFASTTPSPSSSTTTLSVISQTPNHASTPSTTTPLNGSSTSHNQSSPAATDIDPRYGVEKRLVPTGPNPLHN